MVYPRHQKSSLLLVLLVAHQLLLLMTNHVTNGFLPLHPYNNHHHVRDLRKTTTSSSIVDRSQLRRPKHSRRSTRPTSTSTSLWMSFTPVHIATPAEVLAIFAQPNAIILDVRSQPEIDTQGLIQTYGRPWVQTPCTQMECPSLSGAAHTLFASKETPIIVHCSTGSRAAKAVAILDQLGYKHVVNAGAYSDLDYLQNAADKFREDPTFANGLTESGGMGMNKPIEPGSFFLDNSMFSGNEGSAEETDFDELYRQDPDFTSMENVVGGPKSEHFIDVTSQEEDDQGQEEEAEDSKVETTTTTSSGSAVAEEDVKEEEEEKSSVSPASVVQEEEEVVEDNKNKNRATTTTASSSTVRTQSQAATAPTRPKPTPLKKKSNKSRLDDCFSRLDSLLQGQQYEENRHHNQQQGGSSQQQQQEEQKKYQEQMQQLQVQQQQCQEEQNNIDGATGAAAEAETMMAEETMKQQQDQQEQYQEQNSFGTPPPPPPTAAETMMAAEREEMMVTAPPPPSPPGVEERQEKEINAKAKSSSKSSFFDPWNNVDHQSTIYTEGAAKTSSSSGSGNIPPLEQTLWSENNNEIETINSKGEVTTTTTKAIPIQPLMDAWANPTTTTETTTTATASSSTSASFHFYDHDFGGGNNNGDNTQPSMDNNNDGNPNSDEWLKGGARDGIPIGDPSGHDFQYVGAEEEESYYNDNNVIGDEDAFYGRNPIHPDGWNLDISRDPKVVFYSDNDETEEEEETAAAVAVVTLEEEEQQQPQQSSKMNTPVDPSDAFIHYNCNHYPFGSDDDVRILGGEETAAAQDQEQQQQKNSGLGGGRSPDGPERFFTRYMERP